MVQFKDITKQISDLEEQILQNNIKVIPLKKDSKLPRDNKYYTRDYSITELEAYTGNFGIIPGYNHNNSSIAIIDIDGYTMPNVSEEKKQEIKKYTQEYIYDCLKNIKGAMCVRTQSGGYHIYLRNRTVNEHIHETSNHLCFPSDFPIKELQGESLKHSIEIFTKEGSKQCLLPGCQVLDKATRELNEYIILNDIHRISDIGIVDDIHETVVKTLTDRKFIYNRTETITTNSNKTTEKTVIRDLKTLNQREIHELVEIISPIINLVDGAKHTSTLYLGGYFSNTITIDSVEKIAQEIIKKNPALFNDNRAFMETLIENYRRNNVHKGGLPKLCEIIRSYDKSFNSSKFIFEVNRICQKKFVHHILIKKFSDNKKKYLDIDYQNHKIATHIWNRSKTTDEAGNEVITSFHTDTYDLLNMSPVEIYETYNILDRNASPKLCLSFYRKGMPTKQVIEGSDVEAVEKQLAKRPGIVLRPREYRGLINEIILEYINLEQINIIEEIAIPGVFINPLTGKLARASENDNVSIHYPSKNSVKSALKVWDDLYTVYPGDSKKLAHILRWGLLSPFSYILKTEYSWRPCLFLYGASQTSKTTLAEISLSVYTDITEEISIGGGAFDTPYRIGEALSRQGYGTVVNEPASSIESKDNVEIIKRAIESGYSREKQVDGVHTKIPAYSNFIFTSNAFLPTSDAFVRRTDYLEFTKSERLSDDDIRLFNETFHHQNWGNTDFKKLRAIGDFAIAYVDENMGLLSKNHNVIVEHILDALYGYVNCEVPEWLLEKAELMDVGSSDNEILTEFRRMVLKDYRDLTRNSNRIYNQAFATENNFKKTDNSDNTFKKLFITLVKSNQMDYLHYQNVSGDDFILVNTSVKNALRDFCDLQVTCKGLADYMNVDYGAIKYKSKTIRGFRLLYDDFKQFLDGGFRA